MGYTHYWEFTKAPTQKQWDKYIDTLRVLLKGNDLIEIVDTTKYFSFNGKGSDSHEDFWIHRSIKDLMGTGELGSFHFCKTAHKPYDLLVTASLIVMHNMFPNLVNVTSDGNADEWVAGLNYARKKLNSNMLVNLDEKPPTNTMILLNE